MQMACISGQFMRPAANQTLRYIGGYERKIIRRSFRRRGSGQSSLIARITQNTAKCRHAGAADHRANARGERERTQVERALEWVLQQDDEPSCAEQSRWGPVVSVRRQAEQ